MQQRAHEHRFANRIRLGRNLTLALALLALMSPSTPGQVAVPQVSAGGEFSAALAIDGSVGTWGNNAVGQLGRCGGTTTVPQAIAGLNSITEIACGGLHTLALTNTGQVKGWGYNLYGQLGLPVTTLTANCPQLVPGITSAAQVAAGAWHSLVRHSNGTVSAFGQGAFGVLGLGNTNSALTPTLIPGLTSAVAVATGERHSAAVLANGTLVTWGDNSGGQLGFSGTGALAPTPVPGLSGIVAVACGKQATLCIDGAGIVRQWGTTGNYSSSLPQIMPLPAPASAIASARSVNAQMALLATGAVHTWGDDCSTGALGGGAANCNSGAGSLQPAGLGAYVASITFGGAHGLAVTQSGQVSGWGLNNFGQLGFASTTPSLTPTTVPGIDLSWLDFQLVAVGGNTELRLFHGVPTSSYANICTTVSQSGPTGPLINFGGLWITFADMIAWSVFIQAGYPMATGSLNALGNAVVTLPVPNAALAGITVHAISINLAGGGIANISSVVTHTF